MNRILILIMFIFSVNSVFGQITESNNTGFFNSKNSGKTIPAGMSATITNYIDFSNKALWIDGSNERLGIGRTPSANALEINSGNVPKISLYHNGNHKMDIRASAAELAIVDDTYTGLVITPTVGNRVWSFMDAGISRVSYLKATSTFRVIDNAGGEVFTSSPSTGLLNSANISYGKGSTAVENHEFVGTVKFDNYNGTNNVGIVTYGLGTDTNGKIQKYDPKTVKRSSRTVNANYTITVDDWKVNVDGITATGNVTLTLPTVATAYDATNDESLVFVVKVTTNPGANTVSIVTSDGSLIDASASFPSSGSMSLNESVTLSVGYVDLAKTTLGWQVH
jgi:hypothetical protein